MVSVLLSADCFEFFVSGVGLLSGFLALQAPTRVWFLSVSLLFVSGWFRRRRVFSFSFSGAGETQTYLVWVSPCVLFLLHTITFYDPYSDLRTYIKALPRTCFFFFSFVVVARFRVGVCSSLFCRCRFSWWVFFLCLWSLGGVLGFCPGRFFLRCMQDVTNAVLGRGRETRHLPPL